MVRDEAQRKAKGGFTLLEMMVVASILTIVSGMIYSLAANMTKSTLAQEAKIVARDDARIAMQQITRMLRMSIARTIVDASDGATPLDSEPIPSITFRKVADVDESTPEEELPPNGIPLNRDLSAGESPPLTLMLDMADLNDDGLSGSQLILLDDGVFSRVVANNISPPFTSPGDSVNHYDAPLGGVMFQDLGAGNILVTVITRRKAGPFGPDIAARLDQIVNPRN